MDKETFWKVIGEVNRCVEDGDQEAVLEATQRKLMEYSAADIARWHEIKGVYMQLADRNDLWAACAATGSRCSDMGFINFRSWLISQGRDVYMQVLQDPDSLAEMAVPKGEANFEAYASIALYTYTQKKEIETKGLASVLEDYLLWIITVREFRAKSYLWTLVCRNNFYPEFSAHVLGAEEKKEILAEVDLRPDINCNWNLETLPQIVPRLCRKYGTGQGMDIP